MNVFGLDIGTYTIKLCQTVKVGTKYKLIAAGSVQTPLPGLFSEGESDLVAVSSAIKKLHQENKINTKKVVVGLPEGQVFSRIIELPKMNEDELASAIPWEAEQLIPLPLSEVTLDWQIVGQNATETGLEKIKVFLVAAPTALIEKYVRVLEGAGLEVAAIETETISAARSLLNVSQAPVLLIDFGARSTNIAISDKGMVVMTRSIPTAGEALTRAISTSLTMEMAQAEQYKIAYGLDETELEGKVKKAISPVFDVIVSEVKKAMIYWNEKEEQIKNIVLTGGSANLPHAASLLTKTFGVEVEIADPFKYLLVDEKLKPFLKDKTSLFAVAVGLSEKEV